MCYVLDVIQCGAFSGANARVTNVYNAVVLVVPHRAPSHLIPPTFLSLARFFFFFFPFYILVQYFFSLSLSLKRNLMTIEFFYGTTSGWEKKREDERRSQTETRNSLSSSSSSNLLPYSTFLFLSFAPSILQCTAFYGS